jgi:hypothetical protein
MIKIKYFLEKCNQEQEVRIYSYNIQRIPVLTIVKNFTM